MPSTSNAARRTPRILAATCIALSWSCTGDSNREAKTGAAAPATGSAPSTPAPEKSQVARVPLDETARAHMQEHFEAIGALERAVASGDLATVHERAAWLRDHDAVRPEWETALRELRAIAGELTEAGTVDEAAPLAARLGAACGACHLRTTSIASFGHEPLPPETGSTAARMQRHTWAIERMWQGLVAPSVHSWNTGAAILAEAPMQLVQRRDSGEVLGELTDQLHELGLRALDASDTEARVDVYGELLQTCADCHRLARMR